MGLLLIFPCRCCSRGDGWLNLVCILSFSYLYLCLFSTIYYSIEPGNDSGRLPLSMARCLRQNHEELGRTHLTTLVFLFGLPLCDLKRTI
jgi:hypothetical protein